MSSQNADVIFKCPHKAYKEEGENAVIYSCAVNKAGDICRMAEEKT